MLAALLKCVIAVNFAFIACRGSPLLSIRLHELSARPTPLLGPRRCQRTWFFKA